MLAALLVVLRSLGLICRRAPPSRSRIWRCVSSWPSSSDGQTSATACERSVVLGAAREGMAELAHGFDRGAA